MEGYNDEFGNIDAHLPPPQRTALFKRFRSIAITATLAGLILFTISILLIKHHPQLRFWVSDDGTELEKNQAVLLNKLHKPETEEAISRNGRIAQPILADRTLGKSKLRVAKGDGKNEASEIEDDSEDGPMKYLVEPLHYDIFLYLKWNPYEEFVFKGNVSITLHTQEETNHIVIGASDLRIITVQLMPSTENTEDNVYEAAIDSYNTDDGLLVLRTHPALKPKMKYILHIEYYGDLQSMSYGMFQISHFKDSNTDDSILIASNTETPFARTIFPCFDLNTQLASFKLNVCRDGAMRTSATSTIIAQTEEAGPHKCIWDHFATSPALPSRLLGFVTSNYTPREIVVDNKLEFTAWTAAKGAQHVNYLLDIIPKLVIFFENYFGIPIPTSHIDYFGVAEILPYITSKLGIIIVPETDMLVRENETCEYQKERVAKVAATHIAEQWVEYIIHFQGGQNDWIKVSLVQYLQYSAIHSIHPKWRIFDEFFTIILQNEMDTEMVNPTEKILNVEWTPFSKLLHQRHALYPLNETTIFKNSDYHSQILYDPDGQNEVNPTIYSEIFVERNINMGVCLFRMLEQILTENVFRNSIKRYLEQGSDKTNRYKTDSLWSIMTDEASKANPSGYQLLPTHLTLEGIVNEWLFLRDFPILKVVRKYDTSEVSFIQFLDAEEYRIRSYRHLPISFTTESEKSFTNTMPKLWLKSSKQTTIQNPPGLTNDTWLLINLQQSGLFRVNYDENNWRMLARSLEKGDFPASIRAQLIDDALFLGRRGYMNYEFALNMTKSLATYGESEFIVWNTVLRHFSYVEIIMNSLDDSSKEKPYSMFKEYIKDLITPVYEVMFTNKNSRHDPHDHSNLLLRALIFDWACKMGIGSCQATAKFHFNSWHQSDNPDEVNPINPHMRYATLCNAMRYGDSADFQFLYDRYLNSSSTDTNRPIYLRSLYCFSRIDYTLPSILSDTLLNDRSLVHLHDIKDKWQVLVENPITSTIPLDYLLTYWKSILKKFSDFAPIFKNIVEGATASISKEDQLNALYRLQEDIENTPHLNDIFQDVIKHIKHKIDWKYQEFNIFVSWLEKITIKETETQLKKI